MELLYLLGSITSTLFVSTLLSIFLFLKSITHLIFNFTVDSSASASSPIFLYEGEVRHVRRKPVEHSFQYHVRYALFDLDRYSQQHDHLSADRARFICGTDGPVLLLTIPASVGYEQNPLSVYYCYDAIAAEDKEKADKELKMCIAEVTNTPWGERVMFEFKPGSDTIVKPLHVSPFMDMLGNWTIHADSPGESLNLAISVQHPTFGNYFTATLNAKKVHSCLNSIQMAWYFWLMPHKVALWIYLQAVELRWKKVTFLDHPKYANPKYRDDALKRDRDLCCFREINRDGERMNAGSSRWCVWRDAQWPWS